MIVICTFFNLIIGGAVSNIDTQYLQNSNVENNNNFEKFQKFEQN